MKLVWLEDSLNFNKRSPLHEVDKKYTWELEHADKVMKKRKEKQILARKEKARARRAEAKEEAVIVRTDDQEHESIEDKNRYGRTQQIVYCGKLKLTVMKMLQIGIPRYSQLKYWLCAEHYADELILEQASSSINRCLNSKEIWHSVDPALGASRIGLTRH